MPFDDKKWNTASTRGDLGGLAITASLGLAQIAMALEDIKSGRDPTQAIKSIRDIAEKLDANS